MPSSSPSSSSQSRPAYRLSDFDFELPAELIAQTPLDRRSQSRLLMVHPTKPTFEDKRFLDLIDHLTPKDLLVFNDSRVIPARLRARKASGAAVEIMVERIRSDEMASAMVRANRKPKPGEMLAIERAVDRRSATSASSSQTESEWVEFIGRDPQHNDRFLLRSCRPWLTLLQEFGELPLPPYIAHSPTEVDTERYQTVYAAHPGSVAAPTAGLHFDAPMLDALRVKGVGMAHVTLHVGSGTFAPVREEDISKHHMHSEWCELSPQTAKAIAHAKSQGGRVIAVGTTSLRTLESAAQRPAGGEFGHTDPSELAGLAGEWETEIFITPGYEFKLVDALITNFHLPKSTLLMLVSAFAGYETIRAAYAHAIQERYRFFSYGDAMFLERP